MKLESAARGEAEISGGAVNRIGKYSFSNLKRNKRPEPTAGTACFNCGESFRGPAFKHNQQCRAKDHKCKLCSKLGHLEKYCRVYKEVKYNETEQEEEVNKIEEVRSQVYNVNIFKVNIASRSGFVTKKRTKDFKVEVGVNGAITTVTADTGARVSVCGKIQAQKWNLLEKMTPTAVHIKPYNSPAVPTKGMARCAVTFGSTSIPVEWYILEGTCEPILSGTAAVNLGIIQFKEHPPIFKPINMIDCELNKSDHELIQNVLAKRPENFSNTLGKHKSYKVKLHTDANVKPVVTPPRPTPYHLKERIDKILEEMINNDVIEEHPVGEPAPWISNAVYIPKPNGSLRVTLDARNINKAIISSNLPIPRQEDIKAQLAGAKVFSKLDFRNAFWQLELQPESRNLTVFNLNQKLYRYKRLIMGVKSSQGELNAALAPLFRDIPDAHLIHDDLIIASRNISDHLTALDHCLAAIEREGLTLNEEKCQFGMNEVKFWGMVINEDGVQPDPGKVEALDGLEPPRNKELTKNKARFKWQQHHQECFKQLLSEFRKDVLLRYFDPSKPTYLFTDAHITGLGAILAQGDDIETARPVAVASRSTTDAERRYPQIDLEGLGVDYALFRFRNYLVGAPNMITVVTDHMPLCSVFNGNKTGSIRTERYKQRNQDIRFRVVYQRGKSNQTDFLSRRAVPIKKLNEEEQQRSESINNLLYTLHTTPIIDKITLKSIAEETASDEVLAKLQEIIKSGQTWIPKHEGESLQKFKAILPEITITGNGILLKGDRIILPTTLQDVAIRLAHQGSHPGQSSIERRLRYHFFFHKMNIKVSKFLEGCIDCTIFSDSKCKEPLKAHEVPKKCWEKVAVDLFGPMPSRKHVIVVQDMSSRYPAAKLVSSTSADKVLPALGDIYNAYGNPGKQLSDNGPPFNSVAMERFADERNIQLEKIPPHHPSANPVETFMRPLGKTMKVAHHNRNNDQEALQNLLQNYRDTPHPSTGIPPAAMLFRNSMSSVFPKKSVTEDEVKAAREYDRIQKSNKETDINSSKYKKASNLSVGDYVLVRNYKKTAKFQPIFTPEQYVVTSIADHGRKLEIERASDGQTLIRHPNDLKLFTIPHKSVPEDKVQPPDGWEILRSYCDDDSRPDYSDHFAPVMMPQVEIVPGDPNHPPVQPQVIQQEQNIAAAPNDVNIPVQPQVIQPEQGLRRSNRETKVTDRLGVEQYNEHQPLRGEDAIIPPWWPGYPRE